MAQPLTPWVSLYDVLVVYAPELVDTATGEITGDPTVVAQWQSAIDQATWVMWALTGGKVHPSECWIEDYSLRSSCRVRLLNTPVAKVYNVEMVQQCAHDDTPGTPIDFCQTDMQTVDLCCSGSGRPRAVCGCASTVARIWYQTESTLPPGAQGKVGWLADQYMRAFTGDKGCSLPERVTSVTRQGVSWTMLDPMDFIDKKLTGIGRIDTWLATARLEYPSSTLIDPIKSQRTATKRVDCCGGEFESGAYRIALDEFDDSFVLEG